MNLWIVPNRVTVVVYIWKFYHFVRWYFFSYGEKINLRDVKVRVEFFVVFGLVLILLLVRMEVSRQLRIYFFLKFNWTLQKNFHSVSYPPNPDLGVKYFWMIKVKITSPFLLIERHLKNNTKRNEILRKYSVMFFNVTKKIPIIDTIIPINRIRQLYEKELTKKKNLLKVNQSNNFSEI